jgi:uncharacterized membrane protein YfcA
MSGETSHEPPRVGEVLTALGDAASQLGSYVSTILDEQPGVAVAAAFAAGFVAGGGLASPLGLKLTTTTLRATVGNVAALVALDLVRRTLEDGAARAGARSPHAE